MTNLLEALLGASARSSLRLADSQIGWANNIVFTGTCVHIVSASIGVLKLCGAHITGQEYIYYINDYL